MTDEGLATGEVIGGRWRIDRFIASGGFGQVYAASDNSSAAVGSVAVKVLLEGASTAERQGFLAEVGHMNSLHHDNLVRHIDSGLLTSSEQGAVFLVIELCQESLAEYCRRQEGGVLPPSRLAALVDDVSGGLDYLHRSGRVHRDLKPANILRSGDTWKLADFGLVRELSASGVYHVQKLVGTPLYMAPEFFNDGPVGPPSDIWSVGVLLHEILAGNRAHQGQGPAYVHALTNAEPVISPELSPAAAELVRRCLDRDPARRPTAAELPAILAGAGSSSGAVTVDAGPLAAGAAAGAVAGAASTGPAATGQVAGPSAVSPTDPLSAPTVTADAGPAPTAGVESPGGGWRRRWLIGAGALLLCALVGVGLFALLSRDDDDATDATTEAAADEAAAPTTEAATDTPDAAADDDADGDGVTDDVDGEGADDEAVTGTDGGEEANLFGEAATPEEFLALQPGDCTNAVATDDRFAITPPVACDGPHLFEVLSLLEAPEAGGEFPGENALLTGAIVVCTENFERRFGVDQSLTSLSVLTFSPSEEEWNDGLYRQICTVYRSDLQPLLVPIGDDVEQWQWQTGDSISVIELQDGFCFDTPVELAADFAQRVVFVDCTEPHDAEKYGTVLLDDLVTGDDGGLVYPGPEQLARTAFPLCHDRLHELYGADHNDVGITSRAILPSEQDYARTDNPLAVCIVEFDPPADRPLDEVAVS